MDGAEKKRPAKKREKTWRKKGKSEGKKNMAKGKRIINKNICMGKYFVIRPANSCPPI